MNIIKTRAVLNIVKKDGKWASKGLTGGLGINPKVFFAVNFNFKQLCIKKQRKLALQAGTLGYNKNLPVWPKSSESTSIPPKAWGSFLLFKITYLKVDLQKNIQVEANSVFF